MVYGVGEFLKSKCGNTYIIKTDINKFYVLADLNGNELYRDFNAQELDAFFLRIESGNMLIAKRYESLGIYQLKSKGPIPRNFKYKGQVI